tara:strand:+ start:1274 stop:1540 length:267 start_codon:yes stop_codon:yes gene_type:complete
MLSKQSIRKGVEIFLNGRKVDKEYIVNLSSQWTDKELERFQKLLKQGGKSSIQGQSYRIQKNDARMRNSKGEYDSSSIQKSPSSEDRF